jgi:hypothetical protein
MEKDFFDTVGEGLDVVGWILAFVIGAPLMLCLLILLCPFYLIGRLSRWL